MAIKTINIERRDDCMLEKVQVGLDAIKLMDYRLCYLLVQHTFCPVEHIESLGTTLSHYLRSSDGKFDAISSFDIMILEI